MAMTLRRPSEPVDLARWGIAGFTSWFLWAALYFGAAHVTDPRSARIFDDAILARQLPIRANTRFRVSARIIVL